jgi:predicted NAD-dependent protein-ADP-ribosyltransferase YbiA (DUF1768 family)
MSSLELKNDTKKIILRHKVPADNNCLFSSFLFLTEGSFNFQSCRQLRIICADVIKSQPELYDIVLLGQSNADYCDWIREAKNWGGEFEIAILADHFNVEVAIVPWRGSQVVYGSAPGRKGRLYLLYTGQHYDPLVAEGLTMFPANSNDWDMAAAQCAAQAQVEHKRRLTQRVRKALKCEECGSVVESDAYADHCNTVHADDEEFSYRVSEVEIVEEEDAPLPAGAFDLKLAHTFVNIPSQPLSSLAPAPFTAAPLPELCGPGIDCKQEQVFATLEHFLLFHKFALTEPAKAVQLLVASARELELLAAVGGRADWDEVKARVLNAGTWLKLAGSAAARQALSATGSKTIVCVDAQDRWLGVEASGGVGKGKNALGLLLTEFRSVFHSDG